ncbi:MAG: hypothetical protein EA344_02760 [Alkalicoccus sp.]|nr:MAG: hypothetical protein EA344_02760 [Alkalicoccus sp.]
MRRGEKNSFQGAGEHMGRLRGDSGTIQAELHSDQRRTESAEAGPLGKRPHGNKGGRLSFIYFIFKAAFKKNEFSLKIF